MRPKANVIVVSIRPELRFMLRIAGRVNVQEAETMPQFIRWMNTAEHDQLVIIDRRDAPNLARRATNYLRRFPRLTKTILVASAEQQKREPVCDITLRDGCTFNDRLLNAMKLALARKRGPVKGSHHLCPR
jgi:ribosomal protein S2